MEISGESLTKRTLIQAYGEKKITIVTQQVPYHF